MTISQLFLIEVTKDEVGFECIQEAYTEVASSIEAVRQLDQRVKTITLICTRTQAARTVMLGCCSCRIPSHSGAVCPSFLASQTIARVDGYSRVLYLH